MNQFCARFWETWKGLALCVHTHIKCMRKWIPIHVYTCSIDNIHSGSIHSSSSHQYWLFLTFIVVMLYLVRCAAAYSERKLNKNSMLDFRSLLFHLSWRFPSTQFDFLVLCSPWNDFPLARFTISKAKLNREQIKATIARINIRFFVRVFACVCQLTYNFFPPFHMKLKFVFVVILLLYIRRQQTASMYENYKREQKKTYQTKTSQLCTQLASKRLEPLLMLKLFVWFRSNDPLKNLTVSMCIVQIWHAV